MYALTKIWLTMNRQRVTMVICKWEHKTEEEDVEAEEKEEVEGEAGEVEEAEDVNKGLWMIKAI